MNTPTRTFPETPNSCKDHARKITRGGRYRDGKAQLTYLGSTYNQGLSAETTPEHGAKAVVRTDSDLDRENGAPAVLFVYVQNEDSCWALEVWHRNTKVPRARKAKQDRPSLF